MAVLVYMLCFSGRHLDLVPDMTTDGKTFKVAAKVIEDY